MGEELMWSIAWSFISSFFASKKMLLVVVGVLLCGAFVLVWHDYQGAKEDVVHYRDLYQRVLQEKESLLAISKKNLAQLGQQKKYYETELRASVQRSEQRLQGLQDLTRQLRSLQKIRRPEREKDCPIHPAIVYTFDLLRGETRSSTAN
ncbi:unknown protein [Desulfotalea psychrophila LSv54]|uniref:Uncharacterized protein n=2 Tax=Desulfotalea psychrophila TaxID=84980 RepID=Q6AMU5_DESPS|nr:unknown protein [Desulfotalea psychrophila LSv54]